MTPRFLCLAAVSLLATGMALEAEDFDVNRFHEIDNAKGGKETPAKIIYLKEDGSEGRKEDANVVPAIKVELSPRPKTTLVGIELMAQIDHLVRNGSDDDIDRFMKKHPTNISIEKGRIGVDVWASPDFRRAFNENPNSKVEPGEFNGYLMNPPYMDFWILGSQHTYFSNLSPGKWTHVEGTFSVAANWFLEFHVPPGTGFVYLKNFVSKL